MNFQLASLCSMQVLCHVPPVRHGCYRCYCYAMLCSAMLCHAIYFVYIFVNGFIIKIINSLPSSSHVFAPTLTGKSHWLQKHPRMSYNWKVSFHICTESTVRQTARSYTQFWKWQTDGAHDAREKEKGATRDRDKSDRVCRTLTEKWCQNCIYDDVLMHIHNFEMLANANADYFEFINGIRFVYHFAHGSKWGSRLSSSSTFVYWHSCNINSVIVII